jgi:hypothetical protein
MIPGFFSKAAPFKAYLSHLVVSLKKRGIIFAYLHPYGLYLPIVLNQMELLIISYL